LVAEPRWLTSKPAQLPYIPKATSSGSPRGHTRSKARPDASGHGPPRRPAGQTPGAASLEQGIEVENRNQALPAGLNDMREALTAFLERHPPK
jgi:hypothetical protein